MLITLISGVLFYKNLSQLSPNQSIEKLDFDELRSINHEISKEALSLRKNFYKNTDELKAVLKKTNEFMIILSNIDKNTPVLLESLDKLELHFKKRITQLEQFEKSVVLLNDSVNKLLTSVTAIEKKKIKYILDKNDKKDFYRESLLDAYLYLSVSTRENEMRLSEDIKILNQILSFSNVPLTEVKVFTDNLEILSTQVKFLETILNDFKEDSISEEMRVIARYYDESLRAQNQQNENLLTFVFAALGIYVLFLIFILRKRS